MDRMNFWRFLQRVGGGARRARCGVCSTRLCSRNWQDHRGWRIFCVSWLGKSGFCDPEPISPGRERTMDLNTIVSVKRPRQRAELSEFSAGDAWLAGGGSLFSEPQPHLSRLVDLTELGWDPLVASEQGLSIAATCKV